MSGKDIYVRQMVRLKTGGHVMQVSDKFRFHPYQDWPICVWSYRGTIREACIDPVLLEVVQAKSTRRYIR